MKTNTILLVRLPLMFMSIILHVFQDLSRTLVGCNRSRNREIATEIENLLQNKSISTLRESRRSTEAPIPCAFLNVF